MGKILAAGIFLVDASNRILICHPTNHPVDVWSIPKGKVEKDETELDAALRETYEETNIDLTLVDKVIELDIQIYSHKKKALKPYVVFEIKNPSIDFKSFDLKCNSNVPKERGGFPEMDGYLFCTLQKARKLLHPTQVACLDAIEELIEKIKDGLN
tara:strand:- start:1388 stop:1855 length:468 start_codon:yes stop_codon:yes gene_type:complete